MAHLQVTYWRDIPTLVRAWDGAEAVSRPLSARFQDLVDQVAMQEGLAESQAYLAEWRQGVETERAGSPAAVAAAVVAELEAEFEAVRTRALGGGRQA